MVLRTSLAQVVSAVSQLDSRRGVTVTDIKRHLRNCYGYHSDNYKKTLRNAVSEGLLQVKNHRFYPALFNHTININEGKRVNKKPIPILEYKGKIRKGDVFRIILQKKVRNGRTRSFVLGWGKWKQKGDGPNRTFSRADSIVMARRRRSTSRSRSRSRRGRRHTSSNLMMLGAPRRRATRYHPRRRRTKRGHGGRQSRYYAAVKYMMLSRRRRRRRKAFFRRGRRHDDMIVARRRRRSRSGSRRRSKGRRHNSTTETLTASDTNSSQQPEETTPSKQESWVSFSKSVKFNVLIKRFD